MSDTITLRAEPRTLIGKKVSQLRRAGKTPIVLYGPRSESIALQVATRDLVEALGRSGKTNVISVEIEGEAEPRRAIARERQLHPTRLTPLHADLLQIDDEIKVRTEIPTHLGGDVPAVVNRGEARLQLLIETLEVRALPKDMPTMVEVDCNLLRRIGQVVRIKDLDLPEGVQVLADPELAIGRLAALRRAMVIEDDVEDEDEDMDELDGDEPGVTLMEDED
jgi:large subunit ribosomal protein L25